jgi:hypothetical protein
MKHSRLGTFRAIGDRILGKRLRPHWLNSRRILIGCRGKLVFVKFKTVRCCCLRNVAALAPQSPKFMVSARLSTSPDESFFNDMSQQALSRRSSRQPEDGGDEVGDNENKPRAQRIACILCRKRKLRCDGARPQCSTCSQYSHECGYNEVRKKSGPKRGYVKALEARLRRSNHNLLPA